MTDPDPGHSLVDAERRLQRAQLASDVSTLDSLLDDDLLFTGPDGALLTKADDLDAHRSGLHTVRRLEELELRFRAVGSTGVTWVLVDLAGSMGTANFAGRVRYTRTWINDGDEGWRILAAQATLVADA